MGMGAFHVEHIEQSLVFSARMQVLDVGASVGDQLHYVLNI
jgi:hypothetical protein